MSTAVPDQPQPLTSPLDLVLGERQRREVDTTVPILPLWLRDRLTFLIAARQFARRNAYRGGKWTLNGPAFVLLLVMYSPRGLARVTVSLSRYLYDWDSAQVRHQHAGNTETPEYVKAQNIRKANLKARWMVASAVTVATVGPVLAWTAPHALAWIVAPVMFVWIVKMIPGKEFWEYIVAFGSAALVWWKLPHWLALVPDPPWWLLPAIGATAVLVLGWHGRPRNRALVKSTELGEGIVIPLRAPMVRSALCQIGIAGLKEPDDIRLLMDVHRHGPGVQVDLELPGGVPGASVVERREKLAAALKRELGTVWPSVGIRHAAHLSLYVCDEPMVKQAQKPWPLAEGAEVDIFLPQPFVTDQRGEWVTQTFAYANAVIGAQPRMGKTYILRQALLVAGLDVRTKVYALDGKGTGDLAPCRPFAHFYSVGDDDEEVEGRVLPALRELRVELRRRAKLIRELPHDECPQSKVTSELANRRGLEPIVVGIDESQAYFGYGDKKNKAHAAVRDEITAIVTDLVKRGPALGFIVFLATQNVCEETIPRQISINAVIRIALKLFDHTANDQVLGTGAYSRGVDATQFDIEDKGVAFLRADGDRALIVRSVVGLDTVAAERIAAIARHRREAKNRLTGEAAGEDGIEQVLEVDLLADIRDVMDNPPVARMHLATIVDALQLLRPGTWGHLDVKALGGMLRAAGVFVGQVNVDGRNTSGIRRQDLDLRIPPDELDDAG